MAGDLNSIIRGLARARLRHRHVVDLPQGPAKPKADTTDTGKVPDTGTGAAMDNFIRRRR